MTLYLLDGHAIVYRYYYAFQNNPLLNSKGENTSSMFGMAKILSVLFRHYPITHIGVIFDSPFKTWRKELYPEYKAGRKFVDDIKPLIEKTYIMCKTWGIYTEAFKGLEADDIIGYIAKKAEAAGFNVFIVTRDKDFCQLVSDKINLIDLGKKIGKDKSTLIDRKAVIERHGVTPEQIPDYLALVGDTIDNIPGVPSIGEKTAAEMLSKYGSVKDLLENLKDLDDKKRKLFEDHILTLERDLVLTRFKTDIVLSLELDELKKPPNHNIQLLELLENEFEFNALLKEFV
jgi:DNA polymerase-1